MKQTPTHGKSHHEDQKVAVDLAYSEESLAVMDREMFLFNPAMTLINFLPNVL